MSQGLVRMVWPPLQSYTMCRTPQRSSRPNDHVARPSCASARPHPDPDQQPRAGPGDPDAPRLPLEEGERDIPRVPLRYDRAVIASSMLTAQLGNARSTYDVTAHQQADAYRFGQVWSE
ncbi:hypothetical protein [Streptomyces sp. NBC_01264]|uniref:hypothetical protein n=1 Tax=Streptomyces sp. NBC_01264 TaxID=2903804 RepID=UPI00224EB58D|nr:hypothetical protein [Streptomyces sp. NBC_01264]MCX4784494.1 hypothetical protein [Streptomyces sp. NBC_01264]